MQSESSTNASFVKNLLGIASLAEESLHLLVVSSLLEKFLFLERLVCDSLDAKGARFPSGILCLNVCFRKFTEIETKLRIK